MVCTVGFALRLSRRTKQQAASELQDFHRDSQSPRRFQARRDFRSVDIVTSLRNPLVHTHLEEFIRGFQVFDKDGNGFIGAGELRYVLTQLGEKMTESEVDDLLKGVQVGP
jgi:hypothetical protein